MGIETTATINIDVRVDKGQLAGLKKELDSLVAAFDVASLTKRLDTLEKGLAEISGESKEAKTDLADFVHEISKAMSEAMGKQSKVLAALHKSVEAIREENTELKKRNENLSRAAERAKKKADSDAAAAAKVSEETREWEARLRRAEVATTKVGEAWKKVANWHSDVNTRAESYSNTTRDLNRSLRLMADAVNRAKPRDDFDDRYAQAEAAIKAYSAANKRARQQAEADWNAQVAAAEKAINAYSAANKKARQIAEREWNAQVVAAERVIETYERIRRYGLASSLNSRNLVHGGSGQRSFHAAAIRMHRERAKAAQEAAAAEARAWRDSVAQAESVVRRGLTGLASSLRTREMHGFSASIERSLNASLKRIAAGQELQKARDGINRLGNELTELKADYEKAGLSTSKIEALLLRLGNTTNMTAGQLNRLSTSVQNSANKLKAWINAATPLQKAVEKLKGKLSDAEKSVDAIFRASYRLQMVGQNFKSFARMMYTDMRTVLQTFADFEYMALRAQAAMAGFDLSTRSFQGAIVDMTRELRMFEAREVAEAMYYWGSTTGAVVENQKDLAATLAQVTPVMKAAAMTNTGYEAAIKGVYSILSQYGMGLEHTADVTEKLFYITQKTAAEFPDLVNSFKMVGPVAASVGVTFEEVVGVFGELADLGIRGTMSGRAFRQFFIQTLRPAPKAVKALNNLFAAQSQLFDGKTYSEVMFPKGQFIGFTKYIQNLAKATMGLTAAQRGQFLATISTANELPMLIALVSKYRREMTQTGQAHRKLNMEDAAEYFRRNWEMISNSAKGLLGMIRNIIQSLQFEFGRALTDILLPIVEGVEDVAAAFRKWLQQNPEIVKFVAELSGLAVTASAIIGAALTLAGALVGVGAAVGLVSKLMAAFFGPVAAVSTAISIISLAIFMWQDAFVALGGEIIKNITPAVQRLSELLTKLGEGVTAGITGLANSLGAVIAVLMKAIALMADGWSVIADLTKATNELKFAFDLLAQAIGFALVGMAAFKVLVTVKAIFAALIVSLRVATAGLQAFKTAMLKSPLFWFVLGVEAVGFALSLLAPHFERFMYELNEMDNHINSSLKSMGQYRKGIEGVILSFAELAEGKGRAESLKSLAQVDWWEVIAMAILPVRSVGDILNDAGERAAKRYIDEVLVGFETAIKDINTEREGQGLAQITGDQFYSVVAAAFEGGGVDVRSYQHGIGIAINKVLDPKLVTAEAKRVINGLEPFHPDDLEAAYQNFIAQYDFDGMSKSAFLSVAQNLGRVSADVGRGYPELTAALNNIVDNMASWTSGELRDAMMQKVGDRLLIEWQNDPSISETARETLDLIAKQYSTKLSSEAERFGDNTISGMAKAITEAIAFATEEALLMAVPELPQIISDISAAVMLGDRESLAGIMESLTAPLANGSNLISMMKSGGVPEELKNAMVSALEFAVKQGALSEDVLNDFKEKTESVTKSAADEIAEHTVTSVVKDFYEAMGDKKSWVEAIREANKQGFLGENMRSALKFMQSSLFRNLPKTKFARITADESAIERLQTMFNVALFGEGVQKGKAISALLGFDPRKTSQAVRAAFRTNMEALYNAGIISIEQLTRVFPRLGRKKKEGAWQAFHDSIFSGAGEPGKKGPVNISAWLLGTVVATDMGKGIEDPKSVSEISTAVTNAMLGVMEPGSPAMQQAFSAGESIGAQIVAGIRAAFGPSGSFLFPGTGGGGGGGATTFPWLTPGANGGGGGGGGTPLFPWLTPGGNSEGPKPNLYGPYAQPTRNPLWFKGSLPIFGGKRTKNPLTPEQRNKIKYNAMSDAELWVEVYNDTIIVEWDANIPTTANNIVADLSKQGTYFANIQNSAWNIGNAWSVGIAQGVGMARQKVINEAELLLDVLKGESPPKKGPLKTIDKGGFNIGAAWGKGFADGIDRKGRQYITNAQNRLMSKEFSGGNMEISGTNRKEVRIKIDVSSPDGSVDRIKQGELRRSVMDALVVNGLEHYVTIG